MEKTFTNSSTVKRIAYNEDTQTMYVTFLTDKTYQYNNVPKEVYEQAEQAESIGKYIGSNIKGIYTYSIVADGQEG